MNNIIVVIPSDHVAKSLVASGSLFALHKRYIIHFVASPNVTTPLPGSVAYVNLKHNSSAILAIIDFFFWNIELFAFMRSQGESIQKSYKYQQFGRFWQAIMNTFAHPNYINGFRLLDCLIFRKEQQIEKIIRRIQPGLVIMPGSALDSFSFIIGRTARGLGVSTLYIVTHWDYFSKKSLFRFTPDKVYLWGRDMLNSAIANSSIPRHIFSIVGAPQFDRCLSNWPTQHEAALHLELDPEKRWLLYAAPSIPFDDETIVCLINNFIDDFFPGTLGLIYRPHPRGHNRKSRSLIKLSDLIHVSLDDPKAEKFNNDVHYFNLLASCCGVISPWSSLVLECGLVGIPSLCISFSDQINDWDWSNAQYSDHARALVARESVLMCNHPSTLPTMISNLLDISEDSERKLRIKQSMRLAVYSDNDNYSNRLLREIEQDFFSSIRKGDRSKHDANWGH